MDSVPVISKISPFNIVGFYNFLYLHECILKGMKNNISLIGKFPDDLPSRFTLIGRFHHSVMEAVYNAISIDDLQNTIENNISNLQIDVDQYQHFKKCGSVSGWDEINRSAIYAMNEFNKRTRKNDINIFMERNLYSHNNFIKGRPDLFYIEGDSAYLKEFKSGSIREEDNTIRLEYINQIKFYAILLFDTYSIDYVKASLESMHGDFFSINITREESILYGEMVKGIIENANAQISSSLDVSDLATPSNLACKTCQMKIVCNKFIKEQYQLDLQNDEYILSGVVLSSNLIGSDKVLNISVCTNDTKKVFHLNIPAYYNDKINVNDNYLILNLKYHNQVFAWTGKSRIYLNDNC